MKGTVKKIDLKRDRCELFDENGVVRIFDRTDVTLTGDKSVDETIKVHDVVEFTLSGNRATGITRFKRHTGNLVYSFT